jgi:hypothetical protein
MGALRMIWLIVAASPYRVAHASWPERSEGEIAPYHSASAAADFRFRQSSHNAQGT